MLKKVLKDMYIDPALLAELDEEQKELLFCKMREEQIRRWKEWETTTPEERKMSKFKPTKPGRFKGRGKVNFMSGTDGNPWTWVMGEHPNDKSIDEILEAEEQQKALILAKMKALEVWNTQERKVPDAAGSHPKLPPKPSNTSESKSSPNLQLLRAKTSNQNEKDTLQKLEQRISTDIYNTLRLERDKNKEKAAQDSIHIEKIWEEQERTSKKIEQERRSLAKSAREHWSNSLSRVRTESQVINSLKADEKLVSATLPIPKSTARGGNSKNLGKDRPELPGSKEAIIRWFQEVEEPRGTGLDPSTGGIATWFHGIISREETEDLLRNKPSGSFLVRISDKIWGYAISYKSEARCKHFLIDSSETGYQFFGLYHVTHPSLAELIKFHKVNPLCMNSQDFLKHPVGQPRATPDYEGLFKGIPEHPEVSYL